MRTLQPLLIAALICSATTVTSQNLGEIRGKVFAPNGDPLPSANVYTTVNGDLFGTTTDLTGHFVLKPLSPGRYAVTISFVSYQTLEFPALAVTTDRAAYIDDVHMKPQMLDEAEVIHYVRPQLEIDDPSRMSLLAEEFAKVPSRKDPMKFIGDSFAGVTPAPNGEGLYFRGSRTENMVSFIDGVKVSGSVPRVPPSAISSISVYTGGLPARYGDVTGGVIVIETKTYAEMLQHARIIETREREEKGNMID